MRSTRRCRRASWRPSANSSLPTRRLDAKGIYAPGGSSGLSVEGGGYAQAPVPLPPLGFKELLPSAALSILPYLFEHIWDMQATMLQPVGGMDRIAHAIYEQVRPVVRLRTPVTAIRRVGDRVRIEHGPGQASTEADYCVCTLPAPICWRGFPNDFSPAKKAALKDVALPAERQGRVRKPALLGDRRRHLRRSRLDRPRQ